MQCSATQLIELKGNKVREVIEQNSEILGAFKNNMRPIQTEKKKTQKIFFLYSKRVGPNVYKTSYQTLIMTLKFNLNK